jgi:hypothetical protein
VTLASLIRIKQILAGRGLKLASLTRVKSCSSSPPFFKAKQNASMMTAGIFLKILFKALVKCWEYLDNSVCILVFIRPE